MTVVQLAQTAGGFSAVLALLVATIAGVVGYLQLRGQRQAHREREYTSLFSQYASVREGLRELLSGADFDFNDTQHFEGAKFSIAQILRYIRLISESAPKAGGASSPSDWVLLADDADYVASVTGTLHERAVTTMTIDMIATALTAAKKVKDQNFIVLLEALKGQCERISVDGALSVSEKSNQERTLIAPHLDRMYKVCDAANIRIGIREDKNFGKQFRQLQQLSLVVAESRALALAVNQRASKAVTESIKTDYKTFGEMDWKS